MLDFSPDTGFLCLGRSSPDRSRRPAPCISAECLLYRQQQDLPSPNPRVGTLDQGKGRLAWAGIALRDYQTPATFRCESLTVKCVFELGSVDIDQFALKRTIK